MDEWKQDFPQVFSGQLSAKPASVEGTDVVLKDTCLTTFKTVLSGGAPIR